MRNANVICECHDANVLMVHAMMRMYPCRYAMNANAPLWVYHDTNALMQTQFIQKFPLFSKRDFFNTWNQNIFKLNLLFLKSHLFFFKLKAPKKKWVITVRNLWMGHWLRIWWSGSKNLFSQFSRAKRGGTLSRPFSGKMNSLKIKHL